MGLWNGLLEHEEEGLRTIAQDNLRLVAGELSKQLIELLEAGGESLPEIEGREFGGLSEFEQPLVDASIRLRSGGRNELSLQLLETAVAFGLRSGLVDDNRAWALVGLGRLPEAVALWREMEVLPDKELAAIAGERLHIYATEADRVIVRRKVQVLVDEGQIDQAKTVLLQAMLDDPTWHSCTTYLIQVLMIERGYKEDVGLTERKLVEAKLSLEVIDLYLDFVEKRIKDVAANS